MRVEVKNVKEKRKKETKLKVDNKSKKISQFLPNVNKQLTDLTSIQPLNYNISQAVEAMNLESTAEQTFDIALHTKSENKGVNDVNKSMQTSTNETKNNSKIQLCWKTLMMIFAYISLKTG